jgi:flavin reductase (DIM6/NTAB) family NADH-FMN oxidoreductase RutF
MDTAQAALESAQSLAALHNEPIAIAIADGSGRCLASSRGADADSTFEAEARSLAETSARTRMDSRALRDRRTELGAEAPEDVITDDHGTSLLVGDWGAVEFAVAVRGTTPAIEQSCAMRATQMLSRAVTPRPRPASADLRRVMGSFITGVIVAIAKDPATQSPVGFTATGLISLSLTPPLVGLSVGHIASSHPAFVRSTDFTVSVLHADQSDLARQLARSGPEKFAGIDLVETGAGWRLGDASAGFSCRTRNTMRTGDHTLVIGEMYEVHSLAEKPALIFFGGGRFGYAEPHPHRAPAVRG